MSAEADLFASLVVVHLGKTSQSIQGSAMVLPPECAPFLFAAAENISRAVALCHESTVIDTAQIPLPLARVI